MLGITRNQGKRVEFCTELYKQGEAPSDWSSKKRWSEKKIKFEMLVGTSGVSNRLSTENNRSGQVSFIYLN